MVVPRLWCTVRGTQVLCSAEAPLPVHTKFSAQIIIMQGVRRPITNGYNLLLYLHTAEQQAVVTKLVAVLGKGGVTQKAPRCLMKGQSALVEITTSRPICVAPFTELKPLGRFTCRDGGETVAVGIVKELL
eukprot:TRINITY_DN66859_c12_g1_i2.p1 TRINITY_DN66859_c12_g1~~TRINITY_DN66859_c12_g1_i2.p1  ORF type:complete len:131 (+),score=7.89 TRINITY_DN66859_c12_g1_i2:277-669(+)